MRPFRDVAVLLILAALLAVAAGRARATAAQALFDLLDPPVSYSARFSVTSDRGTFRGAVWHVPGTERWDFTTAYGPQALLLKRRAGIVYLLSPKARWYVGIGLNAASMLAGGIGSLTVTRHRLGPAMMNGQRTVRYRIEATAPGRGRFDGDAWFTPDGILVRAAGLLVDGAGHAQRVATNLYDLHRGRVAAARMALPNGYFGLDLSKMAPQAVERTIRRMTPLLEGNGGFSRR